MNFVDWLAANDARILLAILSSCLVPVTISWVKSPKWPSWAKFTAAASLSILLGYLSAISTEQLDNTASVIQNAGIIFMASQGIYITLFKGFGLEKFFNPTEAVISLAQDKVKDDLKDMSTDTAKNVLDPNTPPAVDVNTKIVNLSEDVI